MAIDLTQTSHSTIASVDLEVGDKRSDHWQQKEYRSSMPELKEINLKFFYVIRNSFRISYYMKNVPLWMCTHANEKMLLNRHALVA